MSFLSPQVQAFIAVVEESSFEGAARRLSVTPSAISQRIRSLEDRIGQLLVVRQSPCKPTPAGEKLLTRVKPMSLLEAEAMADFKCDESASTQTRVLPISVNCDSLSTWVLDALSTLYHEQGYIFDICIDDQEYTLNHLRDGSVIGAVTSEKKPLQGCTSHPLGHMRYCAIASPDFANQYFHQGLTPQAFQRAPMIVYNRKDLLQDRFISAAFNQNITPEHIHYIPSTIGLIDSAAKSMGWCVAEEQLAKEALASGVVINLAPDIQIEDALYWQHASVRSQILTQITNAFYSASASTLYRPVGI